MWIYQQSTGQLSRDGVLVATGYAGLPPDGKNNPAAQAQRGVGPIPQGMWEIGPAANYKNLGPCAMALIPAAGTQTFGRSGFFLHGDSRAHPGAASEGCIVMPNDTRAAVASSIDRDLQVIA